MTQIFKPNTLGYKVLTPQGYQSFAGASLMAYRSTIRIDLENEKFIECTSDHKIYVSDIKAKQACRIKIGESVSTESGLLKVITKSKSKKKVPVYDLIGVENGSRFYANSILVSNCEPIIYEETLISGTHLIEMHGKEPIEKQGQIRWFKKPKKGNTYVVGLDPSLGTGGDNAAIEVFELPSFEQVGEWQHNKTPIQAQIRILKEIINYLYEIVGSENDIYYSVENNSIGEASLVAISEIGEENIKGIFLSEAIKVGSSRKYRRGFTTTNRSKLTACAKFKQLVENKKFKINSKNLITELKTFVADGNSFNARIGDTDDLICATLLIIRMMQDLQNYDPMIDNHMRDVGDFDMPMPFIII